MSVAEEQNARCRFSVSKHPLTEVVVLCNQNAVPLPGEGKNLTVRKASVALPNRQYTKARISKLLDKA